jgi:glutathione-specific gamma-glutamylcyclotransferase
MIRTAEHDSKDLWVFAYGSLMWRPGFAYLERVPARLIGLHRALCVFSFVHRGTPERPGLVLGLDRGGMCRGIAYRIAATARADTLYYLRTREQVTSVYVESTRSIELEEPMQRRVRAVCYIVDRSHVQYAGRLTPAESLHHVRQGHGVSGANRDYVLETVRSLEALGYRESDLHLLAERLARSEVRSQKSEIRKPPARNRKSDLGKSDLGKSNLGKSDLGKSNLGKSDLGKSNLGAGSAIAAQSPPITDC